MNQYIGRLLDNRYEILEVIGTGGMAVVYKALCHRLNRLVAVKILKDEFSGDEEFRRRFRAEGEAVAMLSHPNIVQVYDVSSSDNANYIVMELIDGISLKQYMEAKGVLNWKETLHFAMQIAKGLEHAHSRGIVHRDIKPHNVMVLKDGSVKVMDFGIARVMSKSNTLTKEALGSVHYISPEQAKGSYTDNRSDLYSLGVVMYEMMTGRPPFDGESPVAVAIQHINGGAPKPTSLNPNIPGGMEQIILKAMALDIKNRYSSAGEMLQDMEEFRKNPAIVFDYPSTADSGRPRIAPLNIPKTTAEKVVMAKHGTPGVPKPVESEKHSQPQKKPSAAPAVSRNTDAVRRAQLRKKEEERRQNSRISTVAVIACSLVAVVAIIVFLVAVFNGALLNKDKDLVEVPYLIGETYSDTILERYKDITFRFMPQQYDDTYEKGQIMRQEPAGGSKVKRENAEVVITVSMGKEPTAKVMENLCNIKEEEAKAFLTGQGFAFITRREAHPTIAEGNVIRTDPTDGTELKDGTTVTIWVSTGPEVVLGVMPDVVGMDQATALQVLKQLGFTNVLTQPVESQKPKDQVIYQSERKKTEIDVTTEIILEISEGPAPTEATEDDDRPNPENPPEEVSIVVRFTVPTRVTMYELTILHGSEVIVSGVEIPAGTEIYDVELTGSGEQEYKLYVDGVFYGTQRVDFND